MVLSMVESRTSAFQRLNFLTPFLQYGSLTWEFTRRNVEIRHKGSYLGFLWSILNPLLMLGIYTYVFGYVLGGKFGARPGETRVDYALALFVGMNVYRLVAETLGVAPLIVVNSANFVKKVVFPVEILPVATVGASFYHFLISTALTLIGIAVLGPGLGWGALWLPVIFVPLLLLALGVAWFFSALGVFFRDIAQITEFLSVALMFASAVFFPAKSITPAAWAILKFNPLIHAIELSRNCALWSLPVDLGYLAYLYAAGIFSAAVGYYCFQRLRPAFADVI